MRSEPRLAWKFSPESDSVEFGDISLSPQDEKLFFVRRTESAWNGHKCRLDILDTATGALQNESGPEPKKDNGTEWECNDNDNWNSLAPVVIERSGALSVLVRDGESCIKLFDVSGNEIETALCPPNAKKISDPVVSDDGDIFYVKLEEKSAHLCKNEQCFELPSSCDSNEGHDDHGSDGIDNVQDIRLAIDGDNNVSILGKDHVRRLKFEGKGIKTSFCLKFEAENSRELLLAPDGTLYTYTSGQDGLGGAQSGALFAFVATDLSEEIKEVDNKTKINRTTILAKKKIQITKKDIGPSTSTVFHAWGEGCEAPDCHPIEIENLSIDQGARVVFRTGKP